MQHEIRDHPRSAGELTPDFTKHTCDIHQDSSQPNDVHLKISNTPDETNHASLLFGNYLMLIEPSPQETTMIHECMNVCKEKGNTLLKLSDQKPKYNQSTLSYLTFADENSQKEPKRDNSANSYLTPVEIALIKESVEFKAQDSPDSNAYYDHCDRAISKVPPFPKPKHEYSKQISSYTDDSGVGDDYHLYQKPEHVDIDPEYDYITHGDDVAAYYSETRAVVTTPTVSGKPPAEIKPKRTSHKRRLCYLCITVSIVLVLAVVGVLAYFVISDKIIGVAAMPFIETSTATISTPGPNQTFTTRHTGNEYETTINLSRRQQDAYTVTDETTVKTSNVMSTRSNTLAFSTITSSTSNKEPTIFTDTPPNDPHGERNCSTASITSNECLEVICNVHTTHYKPYPDPRNIVLWYHDVVLKHPFDNKYEAYFIKVIVISNRVVPVKTVNRVGSMSVSSPAFDFAVRPGDLYGIRVACRHSQVVCIEFKKGGQFSDGINPDYEDYPEIELSVEDPGVTYTVEPNENISRDWKKDNLYTYTISHNKFIFSLPSHDDIFEAYQFGAYRSQLQYTADDARRVGTATCETGLTWAVTFTEN